MSKKVKAIFASLEDEAASIAKAWKIDRMNGTYQLDPASKIYQYWKRQGKIEEYLYQFGRYKSLEDFMEYTDRGNDLSDLVEIYTKRGNF